MKRLTEPCRKLDFILARLETIEQRLDQQTRVTKTNSLPFGQSATTAKPQLLALHPQTRGIVKLNQQTGCFEYYGMLDRCHHYRTVS